MSAQFWVLGTALATVAPLAPTHTPAAHLNYRVVGRDPRQTEDQRSLLVQDMLSAALDERASAPDYSHIREVLEKVRERERARTDEWEDTRVRPVLPRWKKTHRSLPRAQSSPVMTAPSDYDYFEQY